jgi:hypothetical protein
MRGILQEHISYLRYGHRNENEIPHSGSSAFPTYQGLHDHPHGNMILWEYDPGFNPGSCVRASLQKEQPFFFEFYHS